LPLGRFAPPSRKVQVDVRLDDVVLHALEKEPHRRYQHASEVKTALEHIAAAPVPLQNPPASLPTTAPPRRELWKLAVAILAITVTVLLVGSVVVAVLGVGLFSFSGPKNKPSPAEATNPVVGATVAGAANRRAIASARIVDTFASVPPVVIKTIPESGSAEVDPDLTEIQVTFSKPMKDGNWSWVKCNEENFPEKTGEIHYLPDGRTCVVPVKLKPGKLYATWLNRDEFQDFQDVDGRPGVPYLLIFETKKKN
jgi:RNA polymerase sigma-70 factor (ECF subfamily)